MSFIKLNTWYFIFKISDILYIFVRVKYIFYIKHKQLIFIEHLRILAMYFCLRKNVNQFPPLDIAI